MRRRRCLSTEAADVDAFVVDVTGGQEAVALTAELRAAGSRVDRAFDNRSMKAQMKLANRSGAAYALIVGEDELGAGTIVVKPLRSDGAQSAVSRPELVGRLQALKSADPTTSPTREETEPT